jgi:tripartite-type tricarboxylate transporter receptor subunit TctC
VNGFVLLCAFLPCPAAWSQQDFPSKPIRIVVPSVAGGGTDSSTRIVAARLTETLPAKIVIDNRPGAGSIIGTEMVARAAPDGYTLLAAISTITIQPSMQKNLPFDPIRDFAPVSVFVRLPNVLVGHPSLQPKNVRELIAFSKARPGGLEFASAGTGSNLHLCMEMFLYMARTEDGARALQGRIAGDRGRDRRLRAAHDHEHDHGEGAVQCREAPRLRRDER